MLIKELLMGDSVNLASLEGVKTFNPLDSLTSDINKSPYLSGEVPLFLKKEGFILWADRLTIYTFRRETQRFVILIYGDCIKVTAKEKNITKKFSFRDDEYFAQTYNKMIEYVV